jgi:hypothetical protein
VWSVLTSRALQSFTRSYWWGTSRANEELGEKSPLLEFTYTVRARACAFAVCPIASRSRWSVGSWPRTRVCRRGRHRPSTRALARLCDCVRKSRLARAAAAAHAYSTACGDAGNVKVCG